MDDLKIEISIKNRIVLVFDRGQNLSTAWPLLAFEYNLLTNLISNLNQA